jgi:hypothetical protein
MSGTMDITPTKPKLGKDDDVSESLQNLSLSEQNKKLQAKNKELEEKLALAAPGSHEGKYRNKTRHEKVLVDTKDIIEGVNALDGDKCALWWCNYHIEKLLQGDKPGCYDSYKVHAKNTL